jgi:hypothetical protein
MIAHLHGTIPLSQDGMSHPDSFFGNYWDDLWVQGHLLSPDVVNDSLLAVSHMSLSGHSPTLSLTGGRAEDPLAKTKQRPRARLEAVDLRVIILAVAFLLLWPLKAISGELAKEGYPLINRVITKKPTASCQHLHQTNVTGVVNSDQKCI